MPKLRIPYREQATAHCYDRLVQTLSLYQKGIADIRLAMESNNSFGERLRKVLRLHAMNLQATDPEESSDSWNDEDVYLCCLYDMLEAMYNAEAERIAGAAGSHHDKRKNLDDLRASIARLPFGSSQYRNSIRPRLEKSVWERMRNVERSL
ncbi:hypothetical protein L0222_08485 [bacterium]|nr:hypothetical protein [bacterium]MCI0604274.1 hypothetical protein [bacterium]